MTREFLIQCPICKTYHKAKDGFFSSKKIDCSCGYRIDIREERYVTKPCPHCGNSIVFDQALGDDAICPICNEKVNDICSKIQFTNITCPQCSIKLQVNKNEQEYECPLCHKNIDVQARIIHESVVASGAAQIIKFDGEADCLVWKHPIVDFGVGSQLIVHESQQAVFFKNGQAMDIFPAGNFTLDVTAMPEYNKTFKISADETPTFHSEVYFVNTNTIMGIKWGTDSKVRMFDPLSGIHVELGACGQFNFCVTDAKKLLVKLIGTSAISDIKLSYENDLFDNKAIVSKFKALVMNKVKSVLAKSIRDNSISVLEIDEHLTELSDFIKIELNVSLANYGLEMPDFFITSIMTPDDDPNFKKMKQQFADQYLKVRDEKIKKAEALVAQERKGVEAQTEAEAELIAARAKAEAYRLQAQAEADEMKMKGYTYQDETVRKVNVGAIENASGFGGIGTSVVGDIVSANVGMSVAKNVMDMTQQAIKPIEESGLWTCSSCGCSENKVNFCGKCGQKKPVVTMKWFCADCGTENTGNFCNNCGQKRN